MTTRVTGIIVPLTYPIDRSGVDDINEKLFGSSWQINKEGTLAYSEIVLGKYQIVLEADGNEVDRFDALNRMEIKVEGHLARKYHGLNSDKWDPDVSLITFHEFIEMCFAEWPSS